MIQHVEEISTVFEILPGAGQKCQETPSKVLIDIKCFYHIISIRCQVFLYI